MKLTDLMQKVWEGKLVPQDWKDAVKVVLYTGKELSMVIMHVIHDWTMKIKPHKIENNRISFFLNL